ncbi:type II toxin-antitoxin system RelE/ParE family toxin [Acinetobacter guerrae]|uniref:type II toxin-antitoxin system RelE/ParE family toxin n=1 Tax=Acinetobacter guerrae TaxID=1843371 RepID=UPI0030C83BF1
MQPIRLMFGKKLARQQKNNVDTTVIAIYEYPNIGDAKVADLAGMSVYKFKMDQQLVLLAHSVNDKK